MCAQVSLSFTVTTPHCGAAAPAAKPQSLWAPGHRGLGVHTGLGQQGGGCGLSVPEVCFLLTLIHPQPWDRVMATPSGVVSKTAAQGVSKLHCWGLTNPTKGCTQILLIQSNTEQ